ncbi:MAG TPA: sporulation integral membrane protein YtvI [Bacillota bacterium]
MFLSITKRQWITIIIIILLLIAGYFLIPISIPFIIALITALILDPAVRFIQRRFKINRKGSVIIVFILFLFLIGFAGTFIVTKAVSQVINFAENVPTYINQVNKIYENWEQSFKQYAKDLPPEFIKQVSASVEDHLTALNTTVKEKITIDNLAQMFAKVPQYLISFLVYLIGLFLFMLELPIIKAKLYNLFTEETAEKVSLMNARLSSVILGFFKAQFLLSIIIFLSSLAGLLIIAPDVALIMALIIWIVDLIPIIGSIIILGPWSLFMFLSGNTVMGVKLAILAIILLAIRRIVEPKVMGQQIGLSPLATLIAMFLGLKLFGVFGFIIGPLLVIAFNSATETGIIKWKKIKI